MFSCSRKDVSTTEATECLSSTHRPVLGLAGCRRDDIRRVTFGTKGKGTRAGTSPLRSTSNRQAVTGEVFGSWKVRESARRLNGSVSVRVGGRWQRSRWNEVQAIRVIFVSHRSEPEVSVTAKTARAFREAIARGLDESVVLSRPGNRLTTAEAGCVTVFSERTFRFVVCRFLVRGIVRRPFCGGRR